MVTDREARPVTPGSGLKEKTMPYRQEILLTVVLLAMIGLFSAINPRFLSGAAAANVLQDFGPVMLMAIGETFVIISGGIDLSVGSVLGLSGVVTAIVVKSAYSAGLGAGATIVIATVSGLAAGAAVGLINGILVTRVRLAPFIATLATMGAAAGITLVVTNGVQIAGGPRAQVVAIGTRTFATVFTGPVLVVLAATAIAWLLLSMARFGRYTYAIGSNMFAARAAGLKVDAHLIKVYILSGLMAAMAGIFVYFRLASGSPSSGQGGELQAIAAAVIGGVSLAGGIGRMGGTFLGTLIITSILSGLILIGVPPAWQRVVIGGLIAIAVAVQGIGNVDKGTK